MVMLLFNEVKKLWNDTLKKDGKYTRTSLTMATAWWAAISTYLIDFFMKGFRVEAFLIMVSVAIGSKISDAVSKRINPETTTNGQI